MKKFTKRILALTLICVMLLATLCACGDKDTTVNTDTANKTENTENSASTESTVKDSIIMAINADYAGLEPWNTTVVTSRAVRMNIYETLLHYEKGEYAPLLAESYDISDDNLEYTFHLKKGVKFHDGNEMKADDVVFSYEQAMQAAALKSETASIEKVEAVDEYTVKVTLSRVDAPFLYSVGCKVVIAEKAWFETDADPIANPNGTGAYVFESYEEGYSIKLKAFEDYHGGAPQIKNAEFRIINDTSSAVMALEAGDIDLTYQVATNSVAALQADPDFEVSVIQTDGTYFLCYNINNYPFNDINFRKAMAAAINREELVNAALDGIGIVTDAMWGANSVGYTGNYHSEAYDVEKAKEYIAQSSYQGDPVVALSGGSNQKKVLTVMQSQLAKIGIDLQVETIENNTWISNMKSGQYQMSLVAHSVESDVAFWGARFTEAGIDEEAFTGTLNFAWYRNPKMAELFEAGSSTTDLEERCKYYDEVAKIIYDEVVYIPLYFKTVSPAYKASLTVEAFEPLGYARVLDMHWN